MEKGSFKSFLKEFVEGRKVTKEYSYDTSATDTTKTLGKDMRMSPNPELLKQRVSDPASKDEIGSMIDQMSKSDAVKNTGPATPFDPAATGPAQKFDPNIKLPQPRQFLKQDEEEIREPITEKELIVKDDEDQDGDGDSDFADVMIARKVASGEPKKKAIASVKDKPYNEADVNESLFRDSLNLIKKFAGI